MSIRTLLFLLLTLPLAAQAAPVDSALNILTGPKTGTYVAVGRDIAALAKQVGVKMEVKPSEGSVDNIRRLNSRENAALAIVQSDVLSFMGRSQNAETVRLAEKLRMVLPLYREEVHVLARRDITDFAQLAGKRIVIGEDGSGHMLTGMNLLAMSDVTPSELVKKSPPEGVLDLLDNKVDAVLFVGGKPVKLFQNLETLKSTDNAKYQALLEGVHFLPLNTPRMLEEYQPSEITGKDYEFVTETIPTIAVTAVLVTYDFSGNGKRNEARCDKLRTLSQALRKYQKILQTKGHPKWKEVKFDSVLPIWRKDVCAWPEEVQKPVKKESKTTAKQPAKAKKKIPAR